MEKEWEKQAACVLGCGKCGKNFAPNEERILSVYDHQPICKTCKAEEEKRPDYEEASKATIKECMLQVELTMSDPEGYCYHHFYPFTC